MARLVAAFRLLARLTQRELRSTGSLALNNLLFLTVFALQGSNKKTVAWTAAPFVVLLGVPLLLVLSGDPLERVPWARLGLWPFSGRERTILRALGVCLSPAFWIAAVMLFKGAGWMVALLAFAALFGLQLVVVAMTYAAGRAPALQLQRYVPQMPGVMGGVFRLALRQMMSVLDFYVALALSVCGAAYRWFAATPQPEAYPILAMLVALALSTYALRMFGMDGAGGETRYRLFPVRGWQVLLAKDAAYFFVLIVLVSPLCLRSGLAFGLAALAVGRYASLTSTGAQRRWRFVSGDLSGLLQVLAGLALGFASLQYPWPVLGAASVAYGVSLLAGGLFWEKGIGRHLTAERRERRRRLAKGW